MSQSEHTLSWSGVLLRDGTPEVPFDGVAVDHDGYALTVELWGPARELEGAMARVMANDGTTYSHLGGEENPHESVGLGLMVNELAEQYGVPVEYFPLGEIGDDARYILGPEAANYAVLEAIVRAFVAESDRWTTAINDLQEFRLPVRVVCRFTG